MYELIEGFFAYTAQQGTKQISCTNSPLPPEARTTPCSISHKDPQSWRMWDLVTQLVYSMRGRAWSNHKSMTLHLLRTGSTAILTPWEHPICHHKEAEQAQPKLNRATSLHLNLTTSPNHRAATESCCQWDTQQDIKTAILGHLPGGSEFADINLYWSCWKRNQSLHGPLMVFDERELKNANQYPAITTNNTCCHTSSQQCNWAEYSCLRSTT